MSSIDLLSRLFRQATHYFHHKPKYCLLCLNVKLFNSTILSVNAMISCNVLFRPDRQCSLQNDKFSWIVIYRYKFCMQENELQLKMKPHQLWAKCIVQFKKISIPPPADGGHFCFRPLHPLEFAFLGFLVRTPHPQEFL